MESPDNKKLDWIELSSMASALGDEMVTLDEQKISENRNKFFIVDPTGMRGELLITEEKAQTMIQHLSFPHYSEQLDLIAKEVRTLR